MENLDQLTELPEPLVIDIISRLPYEDAARASTLSKAWKSFSEQYPILYFDHNLFAQHYLVSDRLKSEEADINLIRDMFIDDVDYQLSRATQLNTPIRKLALTVAINDSTYFSRVDKWLELVPQMNVEDLSLLVQTADYMWQNFIDKSLVLYEFPLSKLASSRLRSVFVRGCKFRSETLVDPIDRTGPTFSSLRHLHVLDAVIDEEALENLIRHCQEIETLIIDRCNVFLEFIQLSKFPKLKKAVIGYNGVEIGNINLEDTNLECFKCDRETNIQATRAACAGIKVLNLIFSTINLDNPYKDLTATFPLLEEVDIDIQDTYTLNAANTTLRKLAYCSSGNASVKEVRIECPNLTYLRIRNEGLTELYVDCPKLRTFRYAGNTVPKRVFFSSMPEKTRCHIHSFEACDTMCLIDLKAFILLVMGNKTHVGLSIRSPIMATFNSEEVEAIEASPQNNIQLHLRVIDDKLEENVSALVDGLLWICRPTTLTVSCFFNSNHLIIKYLCEQLAILLRDDMSDKQLNRPCWVHQLKDYDVEYPVEFSYKKPKLCENMIMNPKVYTTVGHYTIHPLPKFHAEYPFDAANIKYNLMTLPDHCRNLRREIRFKFQWSRK